MISLSSLYFRGLLSSLEFGLSLVHSKTTNLACHYSLFGAQMPFWVEPVWSFSDRPWYTRLSLNFHPYAIWKWYFIYFVYSKESYVVQCVPMFRIITNICINSITCGRDFFPSCHLMVVVVSVFPWVPPPSQGHASQLTSFLATKQDSVMQGPAEQREGNALLH